MADSNGSAASLAQVEERSVSELAGLTSAQLQSAQAKLTYLGEQTRSIPITVFAAFFRLPSLEEFRPFRGVGTISANDLSPQILTFSVSPEEFHAILGAAAPIVADRANTGGPEALSFSVTRPRGDVLEGTEVILNLEGARRLAEAISGALDPSNGVGRRLIDRLRRNL